VAKTLFSHLEREPVEVFSMPQRLHYCRSFSDEAIDFLGDMGKKVPVEVEFQRKVWLRDLLAIRGAFGYGIVLSRDMLDVSRRVKLVPAATFLGLLE